MTTEIAPNDAIETSQGVNIPWGPFELARLIQELSPWFLHADTDSPEERKKRQISDMSSLQQNLSNGQEPRWYLPASARILWFTDKYPHGTVLSFPVVLDHTREFTKYTIERSGSTSTKIPTKYYGYARCVCLIFNGCGGVAYGEKTETALDFPDFLEKALTGAFARAVPFLGVGTQFVGKDFDEGARIADTPIEEPKGSTKDSAPSQQNHIPIPPAPAASKQTGITATVRSAAKQKNTAIVAIAETKLDVVPSEPPLDISEMPGTIPECQQALTSISSGFGPYQIMKIKAYRKQRGIPEDSRTWKLEHYQQALAATIVWLDNYSYDWESGNQFDAQKKELEAIITTVGDPTMMKLSTRLFNKPVGTLTAGETDSLLRKLRTYSFLVLIAEQVDTDNFALLRTHFPDANHPLDLVESVDTNAIDTYAQLIRTSIQQGAHVPPAMKATYKAQYDAFIAGK